jgi:hypothetical protein
MGGMHLMSGYAQENGQAVGRIAVVVNDQDAARAKRRFVAMSEVPSSTCWRSGRVYSKC